MLGKNNNKSPDPIESPAVLLFSFDSSLPRFVFGEEAVNRTIKNGIITRELIY